MVSTGPAPSPPHEAPHGVGEQLLFVCEIEIHD
jgi:hypothetical protein